jgi:flagellar hook assembly protein FlgD
VIQNIVATPNPARSSVTITVDYDRPSANVDYRVRIYNLNGMLIKEESGSNNSTSGQLALKWNLTDSAGAPVNPGIYVYRVEIKADGADFVGQSEKIVVLPQ